MIGLVPRSTVRGVVRRAARGAGAGDMILLVLQLAHTTGKTLLKTNLRYVLVTFLAAASGSQ